MLKFWSEATESSWSGHGAACTSLSDEPSFDHNFLVTSSLHQLVSEQISKNMLGWRRPNFASPFLLSFHFFFKKKLSFYVNHLLSPVCRTFYHFCILHFGLCLSWYSAEIISHLKVSPFQNIVVKRLNLKESENCMYWVCAALALLLDYATYSCLNFISSSFNLTLQELLGIFHK